MTIENVLIIYGIVLILLVVIDILLQRKVNGVVDGVIDWIISLSTNIEKQTGDYMTQAGELLEEVRNLQEDLEALHKDYNEFKKQIEDTGYFDDMKETAKIEKSFVEGLASILSYDGNIKGGKSK
jgi:uncharacterized protein YoxC